MGPNGGTLMTEWEANPCYGAGCQQLGQQEPLHCEVAWIEKKQTDMIPRRKQMNKTRLR